MRATAGSCVGAPAGRSISYLQDDQIQKHLFFNYYNLNWKDYEYIDLNVNMSMPH